MSVWKSYILPCVSYYSFIQLLSKFDQFYIWLKEIWKKSHFKSAFTSWLVVEFLQKCVYSTQYYEMHSEMQTFMLFYL